MLNNELLLNITSGLSESEVAVFNSPSYQSWLKDLLELKKESPAKFKKVFSKRVSNNVQNTIIREVLKTIN